MGNGRIRKRENKYTQVSNHLLDDDSLSLKAIGLYGKINYYLTIPDWDLYKNHLMSRCKEGRESFSGAWNELKEHGYLIQHEIRDKNGKYYYEYELSDESTAYGKTVHGKTGYGKTGYGKTGYGKPVPINNTKKNKTLLSNTNTHTAKELCVEIQSILGEKIGQSKLKELINLKGADKVQEYLSNWEKYRDHAKTTQAQFFVFAVTNDMPEPTAPKASIPQQKNFQKREYSEEEYENCYVDVTQ